MVARSLLILLLAAPLAHAGEKKPGVDAKAAVEKQVAEWKGEGFRTVVIDDKHVRAAFPAYTFVAVHFPLYPVARVAPEPMQSQNLFAVATGGKVTHLPNHQKLEAFFASNLGNKSDRIAVARAWLVLRMEYLQDGYYKFKQPKEITPVGTMAIGVVEVIPEMGNSGSLKTAVLINPAGKFLADRFRVLSEENKVKKGIRPRCQATLLLHKEKLVREIAEQDLLVMGRAARGYLIEQRARASADLRREIDRVWQRIQDEGR